MTPQERKLIDGLFDRLATLENTPRDAEAVAAINNGLDRAPHGLYPLVQTVLVQDEALKRADDRIRALEAELGIEPEQARQPGFLDNMRDTLFGRREPQGSVPSVRSGSTSSSAWGNAPAQPGTPQQPYGQQPYGQPPGSGGSFLGTAAAAAAGVVGGALLMNSFRGMFGGEQSGRASAFDQGGGDSPWASGGGDLARQAGLDDIGRGGGRSAAYDDSQRAGLFDVAQNDAGDSDLDSDFGGDFDGGGGDV
jgi:hypothetical protein